MAEMNLTELQHDILTELGDSPKTAVSPTRLGELMRSYYHISYCTANSAWASPKLIRLERRGLVKATVKRHYYTTAKGREARRLWAEQANNEEKEA